MNTFEVAVLRVLVKRHAPLRVAALVGGFPDSCEDGVLSAISNLQLVGFLQISEFSPTGQVSIIPSRKTEALRIVNSERVLESESVIDDNYCRGLEPWVTSIQPAVGAASSRVSKKPGPIKHAIVAMASHRARSASVAFVLAFGILGMLMVGGGTQFAQSPVQQPVASQTLQQVPPVTQADASGNGGHVVFLRFEEATPGSLLITYSHHRVLIGETWSNSSMTFATYVETPHRLPQE